MTIDHVVATSRDERELLVDTLQKNMATTSEVSRYGYDKASIVTQNDTSKGTIASLDGVRAIACFAVVMFHIGLTIHIWDSGFLGRNAVSIIMAGDSGVTLFFVLSGFLLFLPYVKSLLLDNPWPSLRIFYLRRALRIIPGYYLSLFLMILLWHPEYWRIDHLKQLALFLLLFMDSSKSTFQQINGPFWTLAVEWQFYLLLPWIALAFRFLVQRGPLHRRVWILLACLAALICWGILSRYYGLYFTLHPSATFLVPRALLNIALFFLYGNGGPGVHGKFLEDFAIGMFAALCYSMARNAQVGYAWRIALQRLSPWLWGSGLLWLFMMALWESGRSMPHSGALSALLYGYGYNVFHEFALALGFGACILAILFDNAGLRRMFEWQPLRKLGLISYSMYMWHLPLLLLFIGGTAIYLQHWRLLYIYGLDWLWVFVVVIPFSYLFYRFIEKPWMRISDNLKRAKK